MVNKTTILKSAMSFLLIVVFNTNNLTAQNAKNVFENYHKWGITAQLNTFAASDYLNPINNSNLRYSLVKHKLFAVGLTYNFYQYNNWNLKAGLQLQWFGDNDELFIAQEETILPFDYNSFSSSEHERILYLPITAEYFILTKRKINFSLGVGLGLSYLEFTDLESRILGIGKKPEIPIQTVSIANQTTNKNPFYASAHIEANLYFKTRGFLLKTSVIYNMSFKAMRTGDYEFLNLEVSPDTKGKFEQSGDFLGLALTVYFRKGKKKLN